MQKGGHSRCYSHRGFYTPTPLVPFLRPPSPLDINLVPSPGGLQPRLQRLWCTLQPLSLNYSEFALIALNHSDVLACTLNWEPSILRTRAGSSISGPNLETLARTPRRLWPDWPPGTWSLMLDRISSLSSSLDTFLISAPLRTDRLLWIAAAGFDICLKFEGFGLAWSTLITALITPSSLSSRLSNTPGLPRCDASEWRLALELPSRSWRWVASDHLA